MRDGAIFVSFTFALKREGVRQCTEHCYFVLS